MKRPLIKKVVVPQDIVDKELIPVEYSLETMEPIELVEHLAPHTAYLTHPDAARGIALSLLSKAHSIEIERGPRAVNRYFAEEYDGVFGSGANESVSDHEFIKNRLICYMDILGRISSGTNISSSLKKRFVAAWTGDISKLDDLSKFLWNANKESVMSADTKKKSGDAEERALKSHENLIAQIEEMKTKYAGMGGRNPMIKLMGKDGYRGRRETKLHAVFLQAVKMAKGKGTYIRDIYRMARENEVPIVKQVSGLFAEHWELFNVDPESGIVTVNQIDIAAINEANIPQETEAAPKAAAAKAAPKPKAAVPSKKSAPKATPQKKALLAPKKAIAIPAP